MQRRHKKRRRDTDTTRTEQESSTSEGTGGHCHESSLSQRARTRYSDAPWPPRQQGRTETAADMLARNRNNPLLDSLFPTTITHPLVNINPLLANTGILTQGINRTTMSIPVLGSQTNPTAEMAADQATTVNAASALGQASLPLGLAYSSPIVMGPLNLQTQQRLAAVAASQGIGGSFAANNPFLLLSMLARNPNAEALPPGILRTNLPPTVAPANIDPSFLLPPIGLSLADLLSQSQQQQAQELLLHQARQQQLLMGLLPQSDLQGQAAASLLSPRPFLPPTLPSTTSRLPLPVGATPVRPVRTAPLYMPRDDDILSSHQIILRRQIEFFEARFEDIQSFTPGRRKEISVGQVGIRCKHCAAALEPHQRTKGNMYFPSTLRALYQAAQNMGTTHFIGKCPRLPWEVKQKLHEYTEMRAISGHGGKKYWADGAVSLGIYETDRGLRFRDGAL